MTTRRLPDKDPAWLEEVAGVAKAVWIPIRAALAVLAFLILLFGSQSLIWLNDIFGWIRP